VEAQGFSPAKNPLKVGALAPAFLDLIKVVVFIARAKTSAIHSQ
jgi:hypothetical protein